MPEVARKGDETTTGHGCDETTTVTNPKGDSAHVYANNIGIECKGDPTVEHSAPDGGGCGPHVQYIHAGSSSVFIQNAPVARIGDSTDSGNIKTGSPNVFAGG